MSLPDLETQKVSKVTRNRLRFDQVVYLSLVLWTLRQWTPSDHGTRVVSLDFEELTETISQSRIVDNDIDLTKSLDCRFEYIV